MKHDLPESKHSDRAKRCHLLFPAILPALLLTLSGCGGGERAMVTGPNGVEWPAVVQLAYSPSEDDPERRRHMFDELADFLGEKIGVEVKLTKVSGGYATIIEAMRGGKVDVMQTGSFGYMIAHERAGAEAIITRGQLIDGKEVAGIYHSLIATAPETGIDSIEEMKARASDLTFAFTNPASTSGHLIPRSGLRAMGIEPEEAFDKVIFTMSHTNSAMTVMAAKVDVGGMSENTYLRLLEAGQIDEDDLVVLWKSEPIPTGPISVRSDFPEDLKTAVQEAYLAIRHERPDLWADITQASMRPDMIYLRANDSMWDGLRKMANRLDGIEMEFELSTEGREETDTSDEAISPSQVAQVEGNRS